MQVGEMFIAVRPDTQGFDSELQGGVQQAGRRAQTSIAEYLSAGAAIAGMSQLVGAASDLNEAVNVTGLIFTESQASIDAFAEGAAQSLGQSETAAREATATFGGLLQNLGMTEAQSADLSIQLTTLASDLGSAFNTDPADAVIALASALRGESEPIRAYNVQLSDMAVRQEAVRLGLAETTAEVDANGLVQGRLSLIMEQTSAVQGDFANTSDSAANAQRILAAEAENTAAAVGDNFLPVYENLVAVAQGLVTAFGALPGPVQTVVALLAAAGLSAPAASKAFDAVSGSAIAMRDRFRQAGGGVRGLSAAITPGAMGVGAAVVGLTLLADAMAADARRAKEAEERVQGLTDAFAEAGQRGLAETLLQQLREDFPEVLDLLQEAEIGVGEFVDTLIRGGPAAVEMEQTLADLATENFSADLIEGLTQFLDGVPEAAAAAGELAAAEDEIAVNADGAGRSLEDQAVALDSVADAADEARNMLERLFGVQQTADEAAVALQEAADNLTASLQENGHTYDIATDAGRANMAAAREQATAIRDYTIAMIANGASAQDATAAQDFLTGGLRNTLRQSGMTNTEINRLIRTYASVPDKVKTDLDANSANAEAAIGRVKTKLSDLDGDTATVYVNAQLAAAVTQFLTGFASGGPVSGGRTIVVGEKGPELFVPDSDGQIIPNHELGGGGTAMVGGGTVINNYYETNVHQHGPTFATPEDFAAALAPTVARELGYLERTS